MTKATRQILDDEYKGHERIFNGNNESFKQYSACTLKGFVKALYKTGTITKSEYDNELDVIENMR